MENIQHDYFIWEENSYTEQKKNDKNNNESVHCVTTTTTKNDLTQKDWRDITNPKERQKAYKKDYNQANKDKRKDYNEVNRDKIKLQKKVYYKSNKDKLKLQKKVYNQANKDKIKLQRKVYKKDNKDKIKEQRNAYYESNKDKISVQNKAYCETNREKLRFQKNNYFKNRKKTDIQFKLSCNLRSRLHSAINGNYKAGSAIKDLGCSVEEFKSYLESKFQPGMNWDNWTHVGWHIDHIKPLASFDLTDRDQLLEACHYTNLQPLWATDNLIKSDKIL